MTLSGGSTDVRIRRLFSPVIESILGMLLAMFLLLDEPLGGFLIKVMVNLVDTCYIWNIISLLGLLP